MYDVIERATNDCTALNDSCFFWMHFLQLRVNHRLHHNRAFISLNADYRCAIMRSLFYLVSRTRSLARSGVAYRRCALGACRKTAPIDHLTRHLATSPESRRQDALAALCRRRSLLRPWDDDDNGRRTAGLGLAAPGRRVAFLPPTISPVVNC